MLIQPLCSRLELNLTYTAVTMGKKLVVVGNQPKLLAMAVKNKKSSKGLAKLAARIAGG